MNLRPTCEEIQVLAPEVALGIASGDERALVLAHAKSCAECHRVMEELSETADALLLLGPQHEPSSGFESTVLAKMQSEQRKPTRMRSLLAAAAMTSVLVTGVAGFWITADDRRVANHYRDALAEANGKYFGVVPLRTAHGDRAGHLFAYEGDPTWVFLIFSTPLDPETYEAELETPGGAIRSLGTFALTAGDVTWGRDLPVGLGDVRAFRMLDERGAVVVEATFPSR
jgi:hypothetical protein